MTTAWTRPLNLDLIDIGDRLRPVDEDVVDGLCVSFAESGLLEPVVVRPVGSRFALVAGLHRLTAARKLGWEAIEATIRSDLTEASARLAEIDENLMRRELGPLDRAIFLAERKTVWLQVHPETGHGGDRKSKRDKQPDQVAKMATRFSREAAEKLGLAERSIRRAIALAERLTPEARALARASYLAGHQGDLIQLSLLEPEEQVAAARRIAAGEVRSMREATRTGAPAAAQADPVAALVERYARLGKKDQDRFLRLAGLVRAQAEMAEVA